MMSEPTKEATIALVLEGFEHLRVPVEVRSADTGGFLRGFTGDSIRLPMAGAYAISASLPDGRRETWVVDAKPGETKQTLTWRDSMRVDAAQQSELAWKPEDGESATWSSLRYRVLRMPIVANGAFVVANDIFANARPSSKDPQALVIELGTTHEGLHAIQIAMPGQVPRVVALPLSNNGRACRCEVRVRVAWSGLSVEPVALGEEERTILSLLGSGARDVRGIADRSKALLEGKVANPIGAAIGAAALVRADLAEEVRPWIHNLAEWFRWLPDGAALAGEVCFRAGERDRAADYWLDAANRGLPILADAYSYLVAGLSELAYEGPMRRERVMQHLISPTGTLTSVSPFIDYRSPFVSFTALDPSNARASQEPLDFDEADPSWRAVDPAREESGAPVEPERLVLESVGTMATASVRSAPETATLEPMGSSRADMSIEMLKAGHGDCLIIEWGTARARQRMLVDGGARGTGKRLRARIEAMPEDERRFELLVVTHVDADHIEGALELLEKPVPGLSFQDIWFNGFVHLPERDELEPLGGAQGERLSNILASYAWNRTFGGGAVALGADGSLPVRTLPGGLEVTVLSPTREKLALLRPVWEREVRKAGLEPGVAAPDEEAPPFLEVLGKPNVQSLADAPFSEDQAEANGSSIALLLRIGRRRVLLGADAHPSVLVSSIQKLAPKRPLALAAFKLPHHGSKANVSRELLECVKCDTYLVSTSGAIFHHPDRQAIARVLAYGGGSSSLYFNYKSEDNEAWDDAALKAEWGYQTAYPEEDAQSILVEL